MTIPPGLFLIALAIAVGVSLAVGVVIGKLDNRKKPEEQAPQPEPALPPVTVVQEEPSILKVKMDQAFNWTLELDGAPVDPNQMTAEQRARLVGVIVQIRPWIDGKPAANPTAVPPPGPVSTHRPAPVQTPPTPATAPTGAKPAQGTPEGPPKIDIMRGVRSLIKNEIKSPDQIKSKSIVEMIDEFLQQRLAGTPLADKEIRLEEGSLGEVVVLVERHRYVGVDNVPDPEIQAVIRAAIADWDKSS